MTKISQRSKPAGFSEPAESVNIKLLEARPTISPTDPCRVASVVKLRRREDGVYTHRLPQGEEILVERKPDGAWDIYTSGPPSQLGLWQAADDHPEKRNVSAYGIWSDQPSSRRVKREGLLGWLGLSKRVAEPANGAIEPHEVRPLEFLGDDASNRDRYREVTLPPATEAKPWKAKHYEVSMKFEQEGTVESRARIVGVATEQTDAVPLDFSNFSSHLEVTTSEGRSGLVRTTDHGLLIEHRLAAQQEFDFEVAYRGQPRPVSHPAVPADLGWLSNDDSVITFNGVDRSSSWLPGDDDPSNKATYEFHVEVPKGHFAVANGQLVEKKETATGTTFSYKSAYPMASYLASVNCFDEAEYARTEVSPGFEVVHPHSMAEQVRREFANHPHMMSYLSQRLGPYPFESYGAIVTDLRTDTYSSRFTDGQHTIEADLGYQVAFEAQTRPIYPTGAIKGHGDFEETLMHELAHQWFGNAVTKASEQDIWVNEAFPSYSGALWREQKYGSELVESEMNGLHERLSGHTFKDTMAKPDRDKLFSLENYGRMTLSMHALRKTLGDEAFFATLAGVVEEHKYTSISVEQMVATANRLNGGRLTEFFDAWLHSTELPPMPDRPGSS